MSVKHYLIINKKLFVTKGLKMKKQKKTNWLKIFLYLLVEALEFVNSNTGTCRLMNDGAVLCKSGSGSANYNGVQCESVDPSAPCTSEGDACT